MRCSAAASLSLACAALVLLLCARKFFASAYNLRRGLAMLEKAAFAVMAGAALVHLRLRKLAGHVQSAATASLAQSENTIWALDFDGELDESNRIERTQ
jgi:hypothetical protein